jgi:hypothetical protein
MLSKNFCIVIIVVMPGSVSARRDVFMNWLELAGSLYCVDIVAHRAFILVVVL